MDLTFGAILWTVFKMLASIALVGVIIYLLYVLVGLIIMLLTAYVIKRNAK